MSWKSANRSFYYANAEEPADICLDPATTALLVIDIQNTYLLPCRAARRSHAIFLMPISAYGTLALRLCG